MSTTDPAAPADNADYDPFEEFNRSAGIGLVENPYPMFALVRAEHTIKREDFSEAMVPDDVDGERARPPDGRPRHRRRHLRVHRLRIRRGAASAQGRRHVLVGRLRRHHGPGVRPFDPRDGRARAPHLPRSRATGVQPQGDGNLGARPRTRRRRRDARRHRRHEARRPRTQPDVPVPGTRDRAHARVSRPTTCLRSTAKRSR